MATLYIRDVADSVAETLRESTAAAGMSLPAYVSAGNYTTYYLALPKPRPGASQPGRRGRGAVEVGCHPTRIDVVRAPSRSSRSPT